MFALAKTKSVFTNLVQHLTCGLCNRLVEKPASLGSCEHFFCKRCIEQYLLGDKCPTCDVPCPAKDVMTNRQLSTAVSVVKQMNLLLTGKDGTFPQRNITPSNLEKNAPKDRVEVSFLKEQPRNQSETKHFTVGNQDGKRSSGEKQAKHVPKAKTRRKETTATKHGEKYPDIPVPASRPTRVKKQMPVNTPKNKPRRSSVMSASPAGVIQKRMTVNTPENKGGRSSVISAASPASPAINKKNKKGETPLQVACIKGDVDLVRRLLSQGATPNVKDHAGWTPLHECVNKNHVECARLLLENGALINVPGCDNETPLHDAICSNNLDCVTLLLQYGADRYTRNGMGQTAVELAEGKHGMKEALQQESTQSLTQTNRARASEQIHDVTILSTSISREKNVTLQKLAALIHATVVSSFSPTVTHVVTSVNSDGQCPRTFKYLQAILTGKWVLTFDWVTTCLEYGHRVPEEAFEVPGASTSPNSLAPMKGRQNGDQQNPRLFDGCSVYLHGDFESPLPSRSELVELVQLGGGSILNREPRLDQLQKTTKVPFHIEPQHALGHCTHFVISSTSQCEIEKERLCKLSGKWLMDSIANFRLLDPTCLQA